MGEVRTFGLRGEKSLGVQGTVCKAGVVTRSSPRPGQRVAGTILGLIVGAVLSLNLIIFLGTERGYEASLSEVYAENPAVAIAAVVLLALGPVVGFLLAGRIFRNR